ncbi:ABC transporter substrate-binding protein [uncultured Sphaerochaeta sp.]|uniref:ABC transporter substrate-binding protein n=1 Tax=uncultured Sphaerochaeta sp. TaxID=886478 RepID=UPI0029CA2FD5|nr:ABC transporter substrate-binding protein [uncultured Sphaerochaeta sp.]
MKKHVLVFFLILLILPMQIFANGTKESSSTVLTIWDRNAEMEGVVSLFNAEMEKTNSPIRAKFELIPYEQQVSKFISALTAGTAPDIYSLDLVQFPYFISIGAFADIEELYQSMPYKKYLPQGMLPIGAMDGRQYALPYEIDLSVILYNKDMFREVGLDPENPPEKWDEFIKAAKLLTKDKDKDGTIDQWGTALVGNDAGSYMFWFMPFVWGNNGDMFTNKGEVVFDSPEVKETLQMWYDLIHTYKVAPPSSAQWSGGDRYNAFVAEQLAMCLGGNFNITALKQDAPDLDFGVAFIPSNRGTPATFGGGNMIGITKQSKNYDAAKQFIEFAYSEKVLLTNYAPKMALLPRSDLYDNEYYQEIPQMMDFARILENAKTPFSYKYNQIYDAVLYHLQGALLGKIPVNMAVSDCAVEIQKVLK